jgi:hypothetical protein
MFSKNRMLRNLLFFLTLFIFHTNSYGNITIYLEVDCGSWIDRKDTKKVQYESYLIGLLTGMNGMWTSTSQYQQNKNKFKKDVLLGVTNPNQIFLSMDKFCRENPFKNVLEGSYFIFTQLYTLK